MDISLPVILLLASGLLIILFVLLYMFTSRSTAGTLHGGGESLMRTASDIRQLRPDCILIIMHRELPGQWLNVLRFDSGSFIAENYSAPIAPSQVSCLVAAYSNREIFLSENLHTAPPPGFFMPQQAVMAQPISFNPGMLMPGILSVRHADIRLYGKEKRYRLFVQNLTAVDCRVNRYGCFTQRGGMFVPITFHGGMYDSQSFCNRFGVKEPGILTPGQSVCDYFAAGEDITVWWVFEVQMPDGKWLLAGGEIYF